MCVVGCLLVEFMYLEHILLGGGESLQYTAFFSVFGRCVINQIRAQGPDSKPVEVNGKVLTDFQRS